MKERILYYDFLRGMAITAVVLIHINSIGYKFQDNSLNFMASAFIRQIANFGVPLFLSISGYFLASKAVDTRELHFSFLKKQLPRVLIPLIIWSLFYFVSDFIAGENPFHLVKKFLTFQAAAPFYYIFLIVQFYVFLPFFQRLGKSKVGLILSLLISLISCLVIYYIRYYTNFPLPLILYGGNFVTWLVFFVLGIYLRTSSIRIARHWLLILVFLGFLLSIYETELVYRYHHQIIESTTAMKASSFLYSFFVIITLFSFKGIGSRLVTYVGELSFGIYFLHIFVLSCLRSTLLEIVPSLFNYTIFAQIGIVVLTVFICAVFGFLIRKTSVNLSSKYLGF